MYILFAVPDNHNRKPSRSFGTTVFLPAHRTPLSAPLLLCSIAVPVAVPSYSSGTKLPLVHALSRLRIQPRQPTTLPPEHRRLRQRRPGREVGVKHLGELLERPAAGLDAEDVPQDRVEEVEGDEDEVVPDRGSVRVRVHRSETILCARFKLSMKMREGRGTRNVRGDVESEGAFGVARGGGGR